MAQKNINSFAHNMRNVIGQQANQLSYMAAIQRSLTTNDTFVTYEYQDTQGNNSQYQLPSYASIVNRLKSVEESINSLSTGKGAINLIDGSRRILKLSSVPKTPEQISGVSDPSTFKIDTNWFFEDLMFPGMTVDIDLTGKIEDTADRVKVLRVILNSRDPLARNLWEQNLSQAMYDYISLKALLTTNGITYSEDEEIVNLPLVSNTKSGIFQVSQDPDIDARGNVWYTLDNLMYSTISEDGIDQGRNNILSVGDQLTFDDTIFEIIEINQNQNKVRLKRITGAGAAGLYTTFNYYQDPFRSKTIHVRFGAHEYNIIYVKGIAEDYNLQADQWSTPIRFAADTLLYEGEAGITTTTLDQYYSTYVVDWGQKMIEEAKEKAITAWAGHTPNAPTLNADDLRVVQINTQINAALDIASVRNTAALIADDRTKIESLKNAIADLKSELQTTVNISDYNAKQEQIKTQTLELQNTQASYSSNVASFQTQIRNNGALVTNPKYRIRGFFPIPQYQYSNETQTRVEEIIGFDIAYRYVKEDNTPVQLNTFDYTDIANGSQVTGTFSDWNIYQSSIKTRVVDETTGTYIWKAENVADSTEVNINQIDIPIQKGERVEIKARSISEAGYPQNPLKSVWSNSVIVSFPPNLPSTNEIADLIKDVNDDALNIAISNTLNSAGVSSHLDDTIPNINSVNGLYFKHIAKNIAYENTDETTGTKVVTSVSMQDKIEEIEERFNGIAYLGDLSNINYINYDISVQED